MNYLELLKQIILSPEKYEPIENIFRKRHIAAGIPSMYGKYHERKFDALALTFRLESLANILFEELLNSFNLTFITRATLFQIEKYANLFFKALQLDGISSNKLENALELLSVALEVRRFSFSQYIDIFRGFSEAVQDILNTYYSGVFKNNLKQIILQVGAKKYSFAISSDGRHTERIRVDQQDLGAVSERDRCGFLRAPAAGQLYQQDIKNTVRTVRGTRCAEPRPAHELRSEEGAVRYSHPE